MADEKDDGVNRAGLDYRAGYCEGLEAFLRVNQVTALRAKKGEVKGLEVAHTAALELRREMLAKIKEGA